MNDLRERYFNMQCGLFPMVEVEFGELTSKMKDFFCHLMSGVIAVTVKQLFNMLN